MQGGIENNRNVWELNEIQHKSITNQIISDKKVTKFNIINFTKEATVLDCIIKSNIPAVLFTW